MTANYSMLNLTSGIIEDQSCRPHFYESSGPNFYCDYVTEQSFVCSGGGYLFWTQFVMCETNGVAKAFIIIGSILFLFFLFFLMAIVADEFLSKNIAVIVDKLKISQNIAGVTLMAFANGAPDVFTAIASVAGSKSSQADLALSSLLGAAIFDSAVVFASIVLIRPFTIMRRPIIRDILFFLIGLVWLAVIMFHDNQVYIWAPIVFLCLYLMYTITVILGRVFFVKNIGNKQFSWLSSNIGAKHDSFVFGLKKYIGQYNKKQREESTTSQENIIASRKNSPPPAFDTISLPPKFDFPETKDTSSETHEVHIKNEPKNDVVITVNNPGLQLQPNHEPLVIRESGKFFIPEGEEDEVPEDPEESIGSENIEKEEIVENESRKRCQKPIYVLKRLFKAIKSPAIEILGVTIPLAENPWSQQLAIVQCFTSPLLFLFAFQYLDALKNGPHLWLLSIVGSAAVASLLICVTNKEKEPRGYQLIAAFIGFFLSAVWIYELANEIVDIVTMLGVYLNISNEILGVTIIAWANSIGDFIADTSVARKGFPRMGISAVIGGPLYNLFFGFGVSFLIPIVEGKIVNLQLNTPLKIMLFAQSASLIITLVLIFAQRFKIRRFHGIILMCLYMVFLVVVILAEFNKIRF